MVKSDVQEKSYGKSKFHTFVKRIFGTSKGDRTFHIINYLLFLIVGVVSFYPFWYCIQTSFIANLNDNGVAREVFSFSAYIAVFETSGLMQSFSFSLAIVVVHTVLGVFLTMCAAYPLSLKSLPGRKAILFFIVFTMLFSGGTIPYYLLIRDIGLRNNILVYIIPGLYGGFNIIIARNFIYGIPSSLREAAKMDGANDFVIFLRIYLPLSMPIMATLALWIGVGRWNDWMTGQLYMDSSNMLLIQNTLRRILVNTSAPPGAGGMVDPDVANMSEGVKMATVVIGTLPIVLAYPFVQKYFVKGIILGSVKE